MANELRAGVIGAGVFGGHHAAKYADLPGVVLTAVLDTHPERAEALAGRLGARPFVSLDAFLSGVDVVSIASPATTHAPLAMACLAAGKHLYVEKPIAVGLEEADAILALAADRNLVLACGFLERAAIAAIGLMAIAETPLRIEAWRLGPPSTRSLDVSVVLDLMIHDLDLALAVGRSEPLAVEAEGGGTSGSLADEARAEIVFENGLVAVLSASRIAPERERRVKIQFAAGEVEVDFLTHALGNTTDHALNEAFARSAAFTDRLAASLGAFLATVRGEAVAPLATGRDGLRALDLALAVEQALGR